MQKMQNFYKCRICLLEKSETKSLFEKLEGEKGQSKYLPKIIKQISGVKITDKKEPLAHICSECTKAILQAEVIIQMCKESGKKCEEVELLEEEVIIKNELSDKKFVSNELEFQEHHESNAEEGEGTMEEDTVENSQISDLSASTSTKDPKSKSHSRSELLNRKYIRTVNKNKDYFFRCDHCTYTSHFATYYREHLQQQHNIHQARIFKCTQCPNDYLEYRYLKQHIAHAHQNQPKAQKYLCAECGRAFAKSSNLHYHQRTHVPKDKRTAQPSVRCKYCAKEYSKYSIRMHELSVHAAERPHVCGLCQAEFAVSKSLQQHMRTCHPTEVHRCPCCEVKFRARSVYEAHVQRGGCQKLGFNCDYCAWGFKTRERLNKHKLNAHKNLLHLERNVEEASVGEEAALENEVKSKKPGLL